MPVKDSPATASEVLHRPTVQMGTDDPLLTIKEVAAWIGSTPSSLHMHRHKGTGPKGFMLGGKVRYRRSTILQWIADAEAAEDRRTATGQ